MYGAHDHTTFSDGPFQLNCEVRLACPVCAAAFPRAVETLSRAGVTTCPRGHPVPVRPCAGLAEVFALLRALNSLAMRASL
jgi:hypothetical protein